MGYKSRIYIISRMYAQATQAEVLLATDTATMAGHPPNGDAQDPANGGIIMMKRTTTLLLSTALLLSLSL